MCVFLDLPELMLRMLVLFLAHGMPMHHTEHATAHEAPRRKAATFIDAHSFPHEEPAVQWHAPVCVCVSARAPLSWSFCARAPCTTPSLPLRCCRRWCLPMILTSHSLSPSLSQNTLHTFEMKPRRPPSCPAEARQAEAQAPAATGLRPRQAQRRPAAARPRALDAKVAARRGQEEGQAPA